MHMVQTNEFTQLLVAYAGGDRSALDRIVAAVYEELRRLASHYLRQERPGHTLQTTALVNEAYLRLVNLEQIQWKDRAHFMMVAAGIMRRVLVDHARSHGNLKHGGELQRVSLDEAMAVAGNQFPDLLMIEEALSRFEKDYPREAKVFEMKFFSEMTGLEIAEALRVSPATVSLDLKFAKLWLRRELRGQTEGGNGH